MDYATFATPHRKSENTFFPSVTITMAIVVFIGFSRSFFLRPWFPEIEALAAPETIFYTHGGLFTAWLALLIVQPTLIRNGNAALHRRIGVYGAALAGAMVTLGIYGALVAATRPGGFIGVPLPAEQFLVMPFFDLVIFGLYVSLAITWRRNPQSHKRLMYMATVHLLEAAFVRFPFTFIVEMAPIVTFALADLFIIALVAWDLKSSRRIHPVTLWAGILTISSQPIRLMIMGTEPWMAFAGWMMGLVG